MNGGLPRREREKSSQVSFPAPFFQVQFFSKMKSVLKSSPLRYISADRLLFFAKVLKYIKKSKLGFPTQNPAG